MAAEVLSLDPGGVDGDCETSGTDGNSAANGCAEDGRASPQDADVPVAKKSKVQHHHQSHHRRKPSKKKRKWKPYSKMTWEEKKAVQEREEIRADRIRGEMMERGRPVAPYNTTQFIMAEHDPYEEDDLNNDKKNSNNDASSSKSSTSGTYSAQLNIVDSPQNNDDALEPDYTDSPHMAPEFISQDFSEAYERVQEESLATMSRSGLVKEHLSLEKTLSYLQDKLAEVKSLNNSYSIRMQGIEKQLEKLRADNKRLVRENMCLKYGEDHVVKHEAELMSEFQTSDYEYEAPNDLYYQDRLEGSMEIGGDFDEDYSETNGAPESMQISSLEQKSASVSLEEERFYEADNATSEEFETRTNMRRKRRSQKTRDLGVKSHKEDDPESSDDGDMKQRENNFIKHTSANANDNKNNNNNNNNTSKMCDEKQPCKTLGKSSLETMDAASYSSDDRKGAATVSMESLTE